MATGYTTGDPSKLDRSGGTMTGPLVLSGPPTAPLHPATKAYVDSLPAGGGGGARPAVRRAYITTGDFTLAANASWTPIAGFELQLPAAVGDEVELIPVGMWQVNTSDFLDLAVLTGASTIARRSSSGTSAATTADEGDPVLYPSPNGSFRPITGAFEFVVGASDLDTGNVRFVLLAKGSGGSKIFASTNYPFRWRAINRGPVN